MPVFTTEGIIIKRTNFGEADRLLTIITPFKGKITVLARGVRKITSRRGGNVELLNKVKLQIFKGQGMPVLSEAESINTFSRLKGEIVLSSYASHIAELANKLLPEEQVNPGAYNLVSEALTLLEENPRQIFIRAFEVKILSELGFWSLDQIGEIRGIGGIRDILEKLQKESWEEIGEIKVGREEMEEIEKILRHYLEKVLESSLKSANIIDKLRG